VCAVCDDSQRRELIRRYRGEIVGEFGLISNNPRTASVGAVSSVTVCALLFL
jgi:CRP-like cAMP-binding protein